MSPRVPETKKPKAVNKTLISTSMNGYLKPDFNAKFKQNSKKTDTDITDISINRAKNMNSFVMNKDMNKGTSEIE